MNNVYDPPDNFVKTDSTDLTITLTDVNDEPPVIVSENAGALVR